MKEKGAEYPSPSYRREKQGELFAELEVSHKRKAGQFFRQELALGKKITIRLSYENLILLFIVFIMLLVVFFSLGVEKGKRAYPQNAGTIITGRVHKMINKAGAKGEKSEIVSSDTNISDKYEIIEADKTAEKKAIESPVKPYTIQVIAFKKEKDIKVEIEMEYLKKQGYEVFTIPSNEWLQICVGKYANIKDSQKDLDILKKRYPTCYVRKID